MSRAVAPLLLCAGLALAGCDQTMNRQHRAKPNGETDAWPGGATARSLPRGVVAQGDAAWRKAIDQPPPASAALLRRGQARYDIFCSPCHGYDGRGQGMAVQRGYPAPPSLLSRAARTAEARHLFDVISEGQGAMFDYAAQIPPPDRWAIIAYIRALQLSQQAGATP